MVRSVVRILWQTNYQLKTLFEGPHVLAFLPAISLGAYWIGGEVALIIIAVVLPLVIAVTGLAQPQPLGDQSGLDPITALPTRDQVVRRGDEILGDGPSQISMTSTLAIGIDEFEDTVANIGGDARNRVLRLCADRLRTTIRDVDLLGKLDGHKFIIVLTSAARADLEGLIQVSTQIQRLIQEPVEVEGSRIYLSVSIGFCTPKRSPGKSAEALIGAAEHALNDAMETGTGAIRAFTIEMQRRARSRGGLAEELPRALENNQIVPWFQPQIDAHTQEITGFEVLARWQHPENGLVPPGEFLPAAQEFGLLERLGEVMLSNSLNSLRAWDAEGIKVPSLSLNFSAEELRNPSIVEKVRWELERFNIGPDRIAVEVLETVIAQTSNDTIVRNLRAFAEQGFKIDLDDFGTGHASIANIKRFSVGRIKIDRSFVKQIDRDLEQQKIVSAILTLAERLDLETLAEGVETPAELAVLRQLGCQNAQGFGIGRPLPFKNVAEWIADHEARRASARTQPALRAQPPRQNGAAPNGAVPVVGGAEAGKTA